MDDFITEAARLAQPPLFWTRRSARTNRPGRRQPAWCRL